MFFIGRYAFLSALGIFSPFGISVMGYFILFYDFKWTYLVTWIAVWMVSVSIVVLTAEKKQRNIIFFDVIGNGFEIVVQASIPSSILFAIFAIFMDGSWWYLFYTVFLGSLCQGWIFFFMPTQIKDLEVDTRLDAHNAEKNTMPFEEVETIVREFGLFILECKPPLAISFHDIESLPYPKDKIRDALIQGIRVTDNSEMLRSMRGALFTCLPCFQAQVGLTPISTSNFDAMAMINQSNPNPTSEEMQEMAAKFLEGNDVRDERIPELLQLFEKDVSEYSQILGQ